MAERSCRNQPAASGVIRIDGSRGEGGGQIVRTALALAALTRQGVAIERIRAGRPKSGLAPQHLTAVLAAATVCDAELEGAAIGSTALRFVPRSPLRAGEYEFDVAAQTRGGSAGAASLIVQTLALPLAFADGNSRVRVRGGTHVPWSPSADYLRGAWLPLLSRLGLRASLDVLRCGFYPAGGGELELRVRGAAAYPDRRFRPLDLTDRGELLEVGGTATVARLPEHIARRMAARSRTLLAEAGIEAEVDCELADAVTPGAALFLEARYRAVTVGFGELGARGLPAEDVAAAAVARLLRHRESGAAVEEHLIDQLVLPLALAAGESRVSAERATRHLKTNVDVIEQFGLARFELSEESGGACDVRVLPAL